MRVWKSINKIKHLSSKVQNQFPRFRFAVSPSWAGVKNNHTRIMASSKTMSIDPKRGTVPHPVHSLKNTNIKRSEWRIIRKIVCFLLHNTHQIAWTHFLCSISWLFSLYLNISVDEKWPIDANNFGFIFFHKIFNENFNNFHLNYLECF